MSDFSTDQGMKDANAGVARVLNELRDEIMTEWCDRTRNEVQLAHDLDEPILVNTLPAFIDNLAEALSPTHERITATDSNNIAQAHGGERARMTQYGPDQLLIEYQILRDVLVEKLSARVALSSHHHRTIQLSFDESIRKAVLAFSVVQARLREHFVATLTHDLRNPLGASKMALEIIMTTLSEITDETLRQDLQALVTRALNNTRRADRLIQNLLDATVLHAGQKMHLNLSECDMLTITNDVISDLSARDQNRIQVSGKTVRGVWDADALRRAIENLVNNALKYGKPDRPITIKIETAHRRAALFIHNESDAIPPHELPNLFDVFARAESAKAGSKKGWGIGLALVRAVCEAHGGSIGVDSTKERGTTFTIDIPMDAAKHLSPTSD